MKYAIFICLLSIFFSCKKEISRLPVKPEFLFPQIQSQLRDSMSASDYKQLDFTHSFITRYQNREASILRIPFFNKSMNTDFLLLKMERNDLFSIGKIYHLERNVSADRAASTSFDGFISIQSLKRQILITSSIINGYIVNFYRNNQDVYREGDIAIIQIQTLPEIIIVSNLPWVPGWGGYTGYDLPRLMNGGISGGGVYSNSDPRPEGIYGGGGGPQANPPFKVDQELVDNKPGIDLNNYFKCFATVPDAGAKCTIKLLTDIPLDTDPSAYFNFNTNSPGHSFLQITKSNGSKLVKQIIGFYPKANYKDIATYKPVDSKMVDNGEHEYNAAISMSLTTEQLKETLSIALQLGREKYDLDNFNCTNYALDIFNLYREDNSKIEIPLWHLIGADADNGSFTPQGLYQKLQAMKSGNSVEKNNIEIPQQKMYTSKSNGPCN